MTAPNQLNVQDALAYLDRVKIATHPSVYGAFIDAMKEFKMEGCVLCFSFMPLLCRVLWFLPLLQGSLAGSLLLLTSKTHEFL